MYLSSRDKYKSTCCKKENNFFRPIPHLYASDCEEMTLTRLFRGPNNAVPTRTMVAPSSMAISKSPLMPMLRCGNGDCNTSSHCDFNSRNRLKCGRDFSGSVAYGGTVIS